MWVLWPNETHNRQTCPAGKPGVHLQKLLWSQSFAIVCRSPKDHFKRQWMAKRKDSQVNSQINALDNLSDTDEGEQSHYYAMSLDSQCESIHDVSGKKSPKNCSHPYHCLIRVISSKESLFKLTLQQLVIQCH